MPEHSPRPEVQSQPILNRLREAIARTREEDERREAIVADAAATADRIQALTFTIEQATKLEYLASFVERYPKHEFAQVIATSVEQIIEGLSTPRDASTKDIAPVIDALYERYNALLSEWKTGRPTTFK